MNSNNQKIISNAIKSVSDYLDDLSKDTDDLKKEKAVKLAYWLNDYIRFLKFEDNFEPQKCKKYKHGDIIKVHLGFNIGSEEGGLHYAVVIDKNNSIHSPTLTIVPLTSIKPDREKKLYDNEVNCGNAFYKALFSKIETTNDKLGEDITRLDKAMKLTKTTGNFESIESLKTELDRLISESNRLKKMMKEIQRMKNGSIALIGQITTISKIRIYDPKSKYDVLHGIKMPDEVLDIIDGKIRQLYANEGLFSENY